MSDIRAGDLVMIVRDCCGGEFLGAIKRVREIDSFAWECELCKHEDDGPLVLLDDTRADKCLWPMEWVKKIEPTKESARELMDEAACNL